MFIILLFRDVLWGMEPLCENRPGVIPFPLIQWISCNSASLKLLRGFVFQHLCAEYKGLPLLLPVRYSAHIWDLQTKEHFFFVAGCYNWPSLRGSYFPAQLKTDCKVVGLQNSGRWWHTANKQGLVLSCQSEGLKAFEQRISILPPARSSRPQSENPVRYHLQSSRIRGNFSKALY